MNFSEHSVQHNADNLKREKGINLSETSEEVDCRVGIDVPGRGLPLSKEKVKNKGICHKGVRNHEFQDTRNQIGQPEVRCRSSILVSSKGIMRKGLPHEEYKENCWAP